MALGTPTESQLFGTCHRNIGERRKSLGSQVLAKCQGETKLL